LTKPLMLCGLDIETTGLDFKEDTITELGWVVKEHGDPKPLEIRSVFIKGEHKISDEIYQLTKIKQSHITAAGVPPGVAFATLYGDLVKHKVDYIVAHNGGGFDKPFMREFFSGPFMKEASATFGFNPDYIFDELPWLDTRDDIVYPFGMTATNLIYICACLGFVNPFQHAAVFDAFATLKVLESFPIEPIIARSKEPWATVRALILAPFNDPAPAGEKQADKAKARRYRWQDCGDGKVWDKCWVKRVKLSEVGREKDEAPFDVVLLEK